MSTNTPATSNGEYEPTSPPDTVDCPLQFFATIANRMAERVPSRNNDFRASIPPAPDRFEILEYRRSPETGRGMLRPADVNLPAPPNSPVSAAGAPQLPHFYTPNVFYSTDRSATFDYFDQVFLHDVRTANTQQPQPQFVGIHYFEDTTQELHDARMRQKLARLSAQMRQLKDNLIRMKASLERTERRVFILENMLIAGRYCANCGHPNTNSDEDDNEDGGPPDKDDDQDENGQPPGDTDERNGSDQNRENGNGPHDVTKDQNGNDDRHNSNGASNENHTSPGNSSSKANGKNNETENHNASLHGNQGLPATEQSSVRNNRVVKAIVNKYSATKAMIKNGKFSEHLKAITHSDDEAYPTDSRNNGSKPNHNKQRRSSSKRRRLNWSAEDNYLFMKIVNENKSIGEARIRRKLAETFADRRTHEQCANHLRILRAQGKLPPAEEEFHQASH